ncbi:MAG: branched-chain amino acid ABC transporter permease [Clostridiales bacterium]|nr:branched-chain amino acid ABC transporter permease [Candidatus Crickella caballi]
MNNNITLKKQTKTILSIAAIAAILVLVYLTDDMGGNPMLITVIEKGAVYALVAASMNLLNGFTGLFSLGQAGFMLIGAYSYAIFTIPKNSHAAVYQYFDGGAIQWSIVEILESKMGIFGHYLGMLIPMIFAGLFVALIAYLIGIPVLRLKSDYLAIATLGFAEILRAFFQWNTLGPITNASNVLRKYTVYNNAVFPVIIAGLCIAFIVLLINSTYGRAFRAIRDDEIAAEAMGVNLFKHKELAFVISSFFAGIGGALLAMFQTTINATPFATTMTYEILLMVVIGGIGSITGSVIAAFLFTACSEWWLRGLDSGTWLGITSPLFRAGFRKVVFAVIIMLIVLFAAQGIMGTKEFSWDGFINWFRNLPANLKAWPEKHKAKSEAKKNEKAAVKAAKIKAKEDKKNSEAKRASGEKLFTPLETFDHVVVFDKEGK